MIIDQFSELSPVQELVLQALFKSPDYTSTPLALIEQIPYPDQQVDMALLQLERASMVVQVHQEGETVRLRPNQKLIDYYRQLPKGSAVWDLVRLRGQ